MSKRPRKDEGMTMRVPPAEAEQIRIAAKAAHLTVSEYIYRRVTARPVLATPKLAALAQLLQTLKRLEEANAASPELLEAIRCEISHLSLSPREQGEFV